MAPHFGWPNEWDIRQDLLYLDQKRLKQPLYRHPWDDITYMQASIS